MLLTYLSVDTTWACLDSKPFNKLISGSRRVALGDLEFQIQTDTDDDMAGWLTP